METDLEAYYRRSDDFRRYLMENEDRVRELRALYEANRAFFGHRVLDIGCGGGVLGFLLEPEGHAYVGVDANPDMVEAARAHALNVGSRNEFLLADAREVSLDGTFDTVTHLGNALCHFGTRDFLRVVKNLEGNVGPGTHFVVDYRDVVALLFRREWRKRMEEERGGKTIVSVTKGCDTKAGVIRKRAYERGGRNPVEFTHAIWSPFIMEPLMDALGWTLVQRSQEPSWEGWLDVYVRDEGP